MSEKEDYGTAWQGDDKPYAASYGKLMMWFFLITDTLTFSAFLAAYGFSRFKYPEVWPVPEDVFTHFPFLHGEHPLLFVALMTFILIMSSVTMVLAVNYGHKMQKNKVILWLSLTIVGGCLFLGSQAWEWGHFIHGDKGGIATKTEFVVHIAEGEKLSSVYKLMDIDKYSNDHILKYSGLKDLTPEMKAGFDAQNLEILIEQLKLKPEFNIRKANKKFLTNLESIDYLNKNATKVIVGADLYENEYGHRLFADYFYFITGFHGFHVFSGVIILIVILINVIKGTYEKRGHYEMVEKVGLYWHFVDLVWVFVFTFFYLV
ncbi:MAG: cytochrome oxidase subunit III [Flavobacteriales bacterium]|mgnify:FL=1|nr:cytochrome oxidase subunit III [Flavobacteriales bacterium]|tara:strand:+ start:16323 stop:17276 length:954 start_codon:yes stop_codon:yes gene_type:complete